MAKQLPDSVRLPKPLKEIPLPSRKEMEELFQESKRNYERGEKRRKKMEQNRERNEIIMRGVKAGFTKKQMLVLLKIFAKTDHEHWNGRIG